MLTLIIRFIFPLMISTILLYISEKYNISSNGKKINLGLVIIALLIPMIVASSRNIINLGDSKFYGDIIFNYARENNWTSFYNYFHNNYFSIESGFLLLTYLISKFTSNYHILFFIYSMINIILIYDGLNKLKKHIDFNKWTAMLIFYLLFFGQTLNFVRQCLGLAIAFWGLHYIFENKPYKYIIVVLVAMTFHISLFMAFFLYFLYYCIVKIKNKKLFVCVISLLSLVLTMSFSKIFILVRSWNILPSKFFSLYNIDGIPISPFALLTKGTFIIIYILYLQQKNKNSKQSYVTNREWYFIILLLLDLIISQLAGKSEQLYRMSLIFAYIKIPFFAKNNKLIIRIFLIVYCLIYFYMEYIYQGALPVENFLK